ncbi:MAG: cupredoxin domain-containing protein [Thermoleophilia bacterium]|nr:cupredoxin domain-containing protein [Thermoleophilia bacterium]
MRKTFILIAGIAILAAFALVISACGDDKTTTTSGATTSPAEKSQVIDISANKFDPAEVTVDVGTTVTWSNNDSVTHTVTGGSGAINSGDLQSGQNFGYTFNEAGTFDYACTIHPDMKGTVIVK